MSSPVHHDGLFSYQTRQGERWGVRLKFHNRHKSWRGFSEKTAAQAFRDHVRAKRKNGTFVPEKYTLKNGAELLTTTIDHYLTTIEHTASACVERHYGAFWKTMFPRATVKSLSASALEKAQCVLKHSESVHERSPSNWIQHMVWLGHVINHAMARGIATTNPVKTFLAHQENRCATFCLDDTNP